MNDNIEDFLKNEEGAETLEYLVVAAVILGLAVIAYSTNITPLFVFDVLATAMNGVVGFVG